MIRLAPGRTAKRLNHSRNAIHRQWVPAQKYPGEEDQTEKDKTVEKTLRRLLNRMNQELGQTGEINHRMFHTIL